MSQIQAHYPFQNPMKSCKEILNSKEIAINCYGYDINYALMIIVSAHEPRRLEEVVKKETW